MPTGCCYFDYMLEEIGRLEPRKEERKTVLYAPAWGVRSSVLKHGTGIIDSLVEAGLKVIFRPHPQFYVSHKELIAEIEAKIARSGSIEIDRNRTGIASMARSDAMITDLSGVLFDYACLFGKPILLANASANPDGQEGEDLPGGLWDLESSLYLAQARLGDDPREAGSLALAAIGASGDYAEKARRFRDDNFYNFGKAGEAAARNIASLLGERA
jgi:CDP-glycerol glycerophosphotransferase (TagB/SpsB family)